MAALQEAYADIGNQLLDTTPVSYFTGRSSDVKDNLLYNASDDVSFYSQLFDYARDQSVPILSRAMTYYTRDNQSTLPNVVGKIMEDGEEYAKYLAGYTWGADSITRVLLLDLGIDTTEVDNFLSNTQYDRDQYREELAGLVDPSVIIHFMIRFLDAASFYEFTTEDHLPGYWHNIESDENFVSLFMPYLSENGTLSPVFRTALQEYAPPDTLGAFLDYYPQMRDLLRSTNSADNLLHLLLEDTALSIDNIYALQYATYGDDLVVAASVAAQTGNNMATLTTAVSNLGGSYLTIIDTIERMVIGEQEMQLSEHHLYGSSRLGIKNYLPRQVYAYWNNTDVIPVADTGSLLSRRPWYSLEYNDVINGLALSPYGSTDQTTSGSQHLAGQRQYEMTNHLGNVLATLSDLPYKSEGEVLQFRVNPALRAVYDYYPFGSLKPGRYVSDTTENCVTMTQSRWVVKYRDSTVWNTGWVSAPATKPNLGIAQQITLSSIPGNGISIEIEDTAAVGGLMTAVQELSVTPNVRQDIELNLQVVSGTFVLRVLEEVNGTDVLLGSLTVSDAGGSDGTVSAPVSYSISILPSTNNVKLQVSSPITMGTVLCCAPRTMNGYWKKITVPYLEQENIVVTLCDSIGDKYRFGFNGQEKVNELAGIGNHNTAEFWEYDTRLGRRWNVDPKSNPSISDYATFAGNPIMFSDVLGDSVGVTHSKGDKMAALNYVDNLDASTSLKLYYKKGKLKYYKDSEVKTDADKRLKEAIDDPNVNVNIQATSENYNSLGNSINGAGTFDGVVVNENGSVDAYQTINPYLADKVDKEMHNPKGAGVMHETLEAYEAGKESQLTGESVGVPDVSDNDSKAFKSYLKAHNKVKKIDSRYIEPAVYHQRMRFKGKGGKEETRIVPFIKHPDYWNNQQGGTMLHDGSRGKQKPKN